MAANAKFRTQHVAAAPSGYRVKSKKSGSHVLRIAFPPGKRKKGAGKLVEVLHPKKENPSCKIEHQAKTNPSELLIFTNPTKRRNSGTANHKPDCQCPFCKRERGEAKANKTTPKSSSAVGRRGEKSSSHSNKPRRRRRNQALANETRQAVELFQIFHGKDPKDIVEKHVSSVMRKDYAAVGPLVAIGVGECAISAKTLHNRWEKECPHVSFRGDHITLAAAPPDKDGKSKQLYVIGGDQNLESCLRNWEGIDPRKDLIDLGDATFVVYDARKIQTQFELAEWTHKFGEEKGGVPPRLMYNRLQKQMYFVGGTYSIDVNVSISPGIEN